MLLTVEQHLINAITLFSYVCLGVEGPLIK